MKKPRETRETAKALVSPFFAWTNALLKGGEMMLDSMEAAAKRANSVSIAIVPTPDAPAHAERRSRKAKKAGAKRARKASARRR